MSEIKTCSICGYDETDGAKFDDNSAPCLICAQLYKRLEGETAEAVEQVAQFRARLAGARDFLSAGFCADATDLLTHFEDSLLPAIQSALARL